MIKVFIKSILTLLIGIIILFALFTIMSLNDTKNGIFNQDNYYFDKENIKTLHGGVEQ